MYPTIQRETERKIKEFNEITFDMQSMVGS